MDTNVKRKSDCPKGVQSRSGSVSASSSKDSPVRKKIMARRNVVGTSVDMKDLQDRFLKGNKKRQKKLKKEMDAKTKMESEAQTSFMKGEVATHSTLVERQQQSQQAPLGQDFEVLKHDGIIVLDQISKDDNMKEDWNQEEGDENNDDEESDEVMNADEVGKAKDGGNDCDESTKVNKNRKTDDCVNNCDKDVISTGEGAGAKIPSIEDVEDEVYRKNGTQPKKDNAEADELARSKLYIDSDKGPFVVHLSGVATEDNEPKDLHDVIIGHKLKQYNVKSIVEIKKVTRRELKIVFKEKAAANCFLKGDVPSRIGLKAYIPNYNILKTGIIFDIPACYGEKFLLEEMSSSCPIVDVYRCQKRKFVNGERLNEWVPANTVKVTFRGQDVPDEVTFGYSVRKVKPDVPRVIQCNKCLRYGHPVKYCKQAEMNCVNCGTRHSERPCPLGMRCFHCHSTEHDARSKDCPEYLRNVLIKESMFFKNLTFSEANDMFPGTRSQYRIAEKPKEFPRLPQRGSRFGGEERVEQSFPRKTSSDLRKQYEEYVVLNQGGKPALEGVSTRLTYSETTKAGNEVIQPKGAADSKRRKVVTPGARQVSGNHPFAYTQGERNGSCSSEPTSEFRPRGRYSDDGKEKEKNVEHSAVKFINDLKHMFNQAFNDKNQKGFNPADNDLVLMDIGRMLRDFLGSYEREQTSYAVEEDIFSAGDHS